MSQPTHKTAPQNHPISWSFPSSNSNGKEKDYESGFHYYGARYYWSELLTGWLSVDPMADKYPNISPYAYCAWNPLKLVDPDGKEINPVYTREGQYLGNTKEGFTGDPFIMNKNDYETMMGVSGVTNISELCVNDVQTYGGTTFDDVIGRDAISGDAQVEVIKNIISQYDDPDLTNRFGFNASNLASRIGYDKDGKMVGPNANFVTVTDKKENIPAMFYFWRGHSSYELTVENITASLVYHEWLGHEIMGWGEGDNPMRRASSGGTHYACYLSVMISPIYKKTTPAYQKFNEDAFKYLFK